MNVFVLNTGRCGSTTFIKACQHITNFSGAHESRCHLIGEERLAYPPNHIEADNRLAWFLGRLERRYGDSAFYVHLQRNCNETARSFARRHDRGIMRAYSADVLLGRKPNEDPLGVARDYVETVTENIAAFLQTKTNKMAVHLEAIADDFPTFWNSIGAQGNLSAALAEFDVKHNASASQAPQSGSSWAPRLFSKTRRIVAKLPNFLRDA